MSRAYRVEVYTKGIASDALANVMTKRFGWEELSMLDYKGVLCFTGEGFLSGGQPDKEAHEQIYVALNAINPSALISTKWTYLEELPYAQYGDDFDVDPCPENFSEETKGGATI